MCENFTTVGGLLRAPEIPVVPIRNEREFSRIWTKKVEQIEKTYMYSALQTGFGMDLGSMVK
jgi:hypothetical protein